MIFNYLCAMAQEIERKFLVSGDFKSFAFAQSRIMQGYICRVRGRHDPCIVPRAVPCIEAAAAIAVYDALLGQS